MILIYQVGMKKYMELKDIKLCRTTSCSDIVSINTPLTNKTKNMVNEDFLNKMKKGSYLINLARGPIVENSQIIFDNLLSKKLFGYATDVWTEEPPKENDNLYKAWQLNDDRLKGRIIINPHTAYYSQESLLESRSKACLTCLDIINNQTINNRIT